MSTFDSLISSYGIEAQRRLSSLISGRPEDQLRAPLELLVAGLADLSGLPTGAVLLVPETPMPELAIRPDFAVMRIRGRASELIGFIEIKAPGKGAEPRSYTFNSFEDHVNGYIDYLICLHNEQVGSLNDHARLINQLGGEIDSLGDRSTSGNDASVTIMREVVIKYSAMKAENEQLVRRISDLETRLVQLEARTAPREP